MAIEKGAIPITGFIAPNNPLDTYPTHKDIYGQGGLHTVATYDDLLAITTDRRKEGMVAYVAATKTTYQLVGGLSNDNWLELVTVEDGGFVFNQPCPPNYVMMGNPLGVAQPSPKLIDMNVEFIKIKETKFVIEGDEKDMYPEAVFLGSNSNGFLYNSGGNLTFQAAIPPDELSLQEGYVFLGGSDGIAEPRPYIDTKNLPRLFTSSPLPGGQIWSGTDIGIPEASDRMSIAEGDLALINLRFAATHFVQNSKTLSYPLMPASQYMTDVAGITGGMLKVQADTGYFQLAYPGVDYGTVSGAGTVSIIGNLAAWADNEQTLITDSGFSVVQIGEAVAVATGAAATATTQAGIATTEAGISTTQATVSTAQATAAKGSAFDAAGSAFDSAGSASSSSSAAAESTSQAGISTTQAGIATSQAEIATAQAGIATTQAGISTTQAGIATAAATEATSQAGIATAAAAEATGAAAEATGAAATATGAAGTATAAAGTAGLAAVAAAASAASASSSSDSASGYKDDAATSETNALFYMNGSAEFAANSKSYYDNLLVTGLNSLPNSGIVSIAGYRISQLADPVDPQDAATKAYADAIASGFSFKAACYVATTVNLPATYNNGTAGVGATLTGTLVSLSIDGNAMSVGKRVLVKDQTSGYQNGIYVVNVTGSPTIPWVMTRATDYDIPAEMQAGNLIVIEWGNTQRDTSWLQTSTVSTVGTDSVTFTQFTYTPGTFLQVSNNLSDIGSSATARGNLGLTAVSTQNVTTHSLLIGGAGNTITSSALTNGQLLIGSNGADPVATTPTNGTNISWSVAPGALTANLTGQVSPTLGGTGVNNGTKSITLGGNLTTSGAFDTTLTVTGATNITLPTSGTLVNTAVTTLSSLISVGTLTTGTWNAGIIGTTYGGTGKNITPSAGQLVYSTATNLDLLPTINNGILITDASGVASIASRFVNDSNKNLFIGNSAGVNAALVNNNIAIGYQSLWQLTANAGYLGNVALGVSALTALVAGANNTGIGRSALSGLSSGNYNVGAGYGAGALIGSGDRNVYVGQATGGSYATMTQCVFVGDTAQATANNLTNAIAIGASVSIGTSNSIVLGNTSITSFTVANVSYPTTTTAKQILYSSANNTVTGLATANSALLYTDTSGNPVIGSKFINDANANLFLGTGSGSAGINNVGLGNSSLAAAGSSSIENIAIGYGSISTLVTGSSNIGVGYNALLAYTGSGANNNIGIGTGAGNSLTTGGKNIFLGTTGGIQTTLDNAILIGFGANVSANSLVNVIAIGVNTSASTSNSIVLGNTSITSFTVANTSYPTTTTVNQLLYSSATNTITGLATVANSLLITNSSGVPAWGSRFVDTASGTANLFIGFTAGNTALTGVNNTIIGINAMPSLTGSSTSRNVAIGYEAGYNFTTGADNVIVGNLTNSVNTTFGQCTVVGSGSGIGTNSLSNVTLIGYNTSSSVSNSIVLGNTSVTTCTIANVSYPTTTTANQILYSSATNTVTGLTTVTNGYLITNGSGVPSLVQSLTNLYVGAVSATAKAYISGGVQNVTNEDSCLRIVSSSNAAKFELQNTTASTGKLWEIRSYSQGDFDIVARTDNAVRMTIKSSTGWFGINQPNPDRQLSVGGDASKTTSGSWAAFSDARIKNKKGLYTAGLKEILGLEVVKFTYKTKYHKVLSLTKEDKEKVHVGLIAQEVEKVMPECILGRHKKGDINDMRMLDITNITYATINALKEINARLDKLENI